MDETNTDLANWAAGSNKEPVKPGIEEVGQEPDLFGEDDEV